MKNEINIFSIVPIEVIQDQRLTKNQLKVLIALFSFRGKNTNLVYPSREKISERCGIRPTTISLITTELSELGWLKKTGKGGFSKATRYKLTVPKSSTVLKTCTVPKTSTRKGVPKTSTRKEHKKEHKNNVRFDEFWSLYPRKLNKKKAKSAFNNLTKAKQDLAIEDIKTRFNDINEVRFIPHATTYINGERWEDESENQTFVDKHFADAI